MAGAASSSSSARASAMRPQLLAGTRDQLPDEMRELRAITERVRAVLDLRGYGEVATPALEYEGVLARGGVGTVGGAYRLFDEAGDVLVLRSDMTIPIARVVGARYPTVEPPMRFSYFAHSYRSVRPSRGHAREVLQAGIELVGAPAPDGTAEAVTVLCAALDAAGLEGYRVGIGDASLYPAMLEGMGVGAAARDRLVAELAARDFVALEREVEGLRLEPEAAELARTVPQRRGGPEVLDLPAGPGADAVAGLRQVHAQLAPAVAERVILDLGLSRSLGYYTGAIFEVYDRAIGAPIGGGGRYDDLLGRFGRALPAVGWALDVEQLHVALVGERRAR